MKTKRIVSVTIKHVMDESPDTSYLGEYGNDATSDYTICRRHDEDCPSFWYSGDECADSCSADNVSSREYRFFNPNVENHKGLSDDEIRKYCKQDYERMEALNAGDWYYMGIRAQAEIAVNGVCQTITSGGLWGIESNSDADYIRSIEQDELAHLEEQLAELGFKKRAVKQALQDVERKTA
ncbi:MAG: hypothetical protein ACJ71Q_09105 [Terriglobales bacterium]